MQRVAVVVFPGSNCDADTLDAAHAAGSNAYFVWHRDTDLKQADAVILPGGFSYGDYLRSGAIARFSPVMRAVTAHARAGGAVLGICNGFQILCEAGLLSGALMRNAGLKFLSRPVRVRLEATDTPFTVQYERGEELTLPIAHGDGRYVADSEDGAPQHPPPAFRLPPPVFMGTPLRWPRREFPNPPGPSPRRCLRED